MATTQLKQEDVNPALLQRAADELEIGVPIHAWEVREGKLHLHLAYGQEAVWPAQRGKDPGGERGLRLGVDYVWTKDGGPELPQSLDGLKKQILVKLALEHGLQIKREKNFLKADYRAVLERRREALQ